MVVGSELAMPIIVLNMGGEMVYILNQRLQAQNVPDEKARKVLEDVVRTMYTPLFLEELFKPQEVYTASSTKQIFEKLAHSSIMRLNKTSMDKLYDLMTMGVKYQLISCKSPQQYLQITLNHLDSLIDLIRSDSVNTLVHDAISKSINLYSQITNGQWIQLEQVILAFFQGKKIKVSLFLQQNLQTLTGTLVLSNIGSLPYGTERPGVIKYFEEDKLIRTDSFPHNQADGCYESSEVFDTQSRLGTNMYAKPGTESKDAKMSASLLEATKAFTSLSPAKSPLSSLSSPVTNRKADAKITVPTRVSKSSAKAELTMLSDLLGISDYNSSKADSKNNDKLFKINLFPNQQFHNSANAKEYDENEDNYSISDNQFITVDFDGAADAKNIEYYMNTLDLKDNSAGSKSDNKDEEDEDDLLALMDSAK